MKTVVLPDPLVWAAGAPYGLLALAALVSARRDLRCYVASSGPMLEEVVTTCRLLGLESLVHYAPTPEDLLLAADAVLLPRIRTLPTPRAASLHGRVVITSCATDLPREAVVWPFPPRDWRRAAQQLERLWGDSSGGGDRAAPAEARCTLRRRLDRP